MACHFIFDAATQFHELFGILLHRNIGGIDRLPGWDSGGVPRIVERDKDNHAVSRFGDLLLARVAAPHIHRQVHAGGAGEDQLGAHFDQRARELKDHANVVEGIVAHA